MRTDPEFILPTSPDNARRVAERNRELALIIHRDVLGEPVTGNLADPNTINAFRWGPGDEEWGASCEHTSADGVKFHLVTFDSVLSQLTLGIYPTIVDCYLPHHLAAEPVAEIVRQLIGLHADLHRYTHTPVPAEGDAADEEE